MRLLILLAILPVAVSAKKASVTNHLRAALDHMPLSDVNLSFPIAAVFADISGGGDARAAERLPVSSAAVSALANGGAEAWSDKAGLPAADAGAFLNYGIPPAEVTIWTVLSTGTLAGARDNRSCRDGASSRSVRIDEGQDRHGYAYDF